MQKLCRKVQKNRSQLLVAGPLILRDKARPHIADVVTRILRDCGSEELPLAPYSPDMSPIDFELFPKLKGPKRGLRFSSPEEVSTDELLDT